MTGLKEKKKRGKDHKGKEKHGLKSRYRYLTVIFSINIGHRDNISPDIGRYYRFNIILSFWIPQNPK